MRDHASGYEDSVPEDGDRTASGSANPGLPPPMPAPSRAWRSIERYRELRELRRHLDDFLRESEPRDLQI